MFPRRLARRLPLAVPAVLSLLLAACGATQSVRLSIDPGTAVLNPGGTVTVTVSIASATAPGPFTLSTGALPAGVTASFSDDTLGAAGDSSDLTLSATPAASEDTFTVTISASGASASATESLEVTVELLTVNGRVVGALGEPIAGATVLVHGQGTTVTGADGSFSLEGLTVPYDVTLLSVADQWAHTFEGLIASDVDLFPLSSLVVQPAVATATVNGELTAPVPAGRQVYLCVQGVAQPVYGCDYVYDTDTAYSITVTWREGMSTDVRLRAIEYSVDPMTFSPVAITGAAASGVFSVTEGGASDVDLTMGGPVAPATFTATVETDFAADSYNGGAMTHLTEHFTLGLSGGGSATPTLAVFTPFFSNSTYTVFGGASTAAGGSSIAWRTGVAQGASVQLSVPAPPAALAPADSAVDVDHDTVFTVSNPAGGVLTFQFSPDVSGPFYALTTMSTSVSIPDLSTAGLTLPAAASYGWSAFGTPEVTDMQAAASGLGYLGAYVEIAYALQGGPAPSTDGRLSLSEYRSFTTP